MPNNPLLPGANHFISLAEAKEMTARYRAQRENILLPEYRDKDILLTCETFNRDEFDTVLALPGCVGLRVYFGMTPALQVSVIIVGVDADNNDILPAEGAAGNMTTNGGKVIEAGQPCPPWCPHPPL